MQGQGSVKTTVQVLVKCADEISRCKHLCCREGLDKPPKAPKTSFVPASTLVNVSDIPKSQPTKQLKLALSTGIKPSPTARTNAIEKVNLANEHEVSGPTKKTPRQMQVLDKLHQSVNKRASVPTVSQKKPSIDFSSDDQPRLSFLTDDDRMISTPRDSTDYGDNWTTEFPSPSELLDQTKRDVSRVSRSGFRDIETSNPDQTFDTNSLENFDLSQFDNDEWDTEAALVGLSDSIMMQEESNSAQQNLDLSTMKTAPPRTVFAPNLPISNHKHDTAPTSIPDKRPAELSRTPSEDNNPTQTSKSSKRQKLNQTDHENYQAGSPIQQPLPHPTKIHQTPPPPPAAPVIKSGHPAWVYDLDPAFIAEYQDIVEFV